MDCERVCSVHARVFQRMLTCVRVNGTRQVYVFVCAHFYVCV
jgi:hypothetical protein